VLNIADPSQTQAIVFQLLGDAKEDREGLLQSLVSNVAESSTIDTSPTALIVSSDELSSFKVAISWENCDNWTKAIAIKYESHLVNKTWYYVEYPQNARTIGIMWRFMVKRDANGSIIKYEARLCAPRDQQTNRIDYNETFAPTVRYIALREVLAFACCHDLEVKQFNEVSAFLNADVHETIYMHHLEGFQQFHSKGKKMICKLNRALYGIKLGLRAWNSCVTEWIENYGLTQSHVDPGIYTTI
jgi:hypothetical protein